MKIPREALMPRILRKAVGAALFLCCSLALTIANAAAPDLKTPAPVIYLADNLDEKDKLGWCIDTLGRGFSEKLQAHSCKPQGGDVQFLYDEEKLHIASAEFAGKCVTLNNDPAQGATFDLLDCESDDPTQKFIYGDETRTFHSQNHDSLCIAVGEVSRTAGPFMSRTLELVSCAETAPERLQWVIVAE